MVHPLLNFNQFFTLESPKSIDDDDDDDGYRCSFIFIFQLAIYCVNLRTNKEKDWKLLIWIADVQD